MGRIRRELPRWGIDPKMELHANVWVQERDQFPASCYPAKRIAALRFALERLSECRGVGLLHTMVDHSQPHPQGFDGRIAVFEQLFLDFEAWIASRMRGQVVFDHNAPGPVVKLYRWHRGRGNLRGQPCEPLPEHSHIRDELQFADLCAYFLLQQSSPATQVSKAGAQNLIESVANLNLLPSVQGGVRVTWQ